MSNLKSAGKYMQETLKTEDKQSKSDNSQRIYSNCVSTHDDICFLDTEEAL